LHAEDRRREPGELRCYDFCFAEMYCCLISLFLQPETEEDPKGEAIERHAEAEMPVMEVAVTDAAGNPDKTEIPHQSEV
jgi:hypothetical protein